MGREEYKILTGRSFLREKYRNRIPEMTSGVPGAFL
jgi:hypothetical protein